MGRRRSIWSWVSAASHQTLPCRLVTLFVCLKWSSVLRLSTRRPWHDSHRESDFGSNQMEHPGPFSHYRDCRESCHDESNEIPSSKRCPDNSSIANRFAWVCRFSISISARNRTDTLYTAIQILMEAIPQFHPHIQNSIGSSSRMASESRNSRAYENRCVQRCYRPVGTDSRRRWRTGVTGYLVAIRSGDSNSDRWSDVNYAGDAQIHRELLPIESRSMTGVRLNRHARALELLD